MRRAKRIHYRRHANVEVEGRNTQSQPVVDVEIQIEPELEDEDSVRYWHTTRQWAARTLDYYSDSDHQDEEDNAKALKEYAEMNDY